MRSVVTITVRNQTDFHYIPLEGNQTPSKVGLDFRYEEKNQFESISTWRAGKKQNFNQLKNGKNLKKKLETIWDLFRTLCDHSNRGDYERKLGTRTKNKLDVQSSSTQKRTRQKLQRMWFKKLEARTQLTQEAHELWNLWI